MRFLLILSLIAAPAAAAPPPEARSPLHSTAARACPPTPAKLAAQLGGTTKLHKLTDLPPANAYAAVYRQVDGCEAPVVVRYNIGPQPERPARK